MNAIAEKALETLKEKLGHDNCSVEVVKDCGYGEEIILRAGYAWTGPGGVRSTFFVQDGQDPWPFAENCVEYLYTTVHQYNNK